MVWINPGSGPVPATTEQAAADAVAEFIRDLRAKSIEVTATHRRPDLDYGDGRYAYLLGTADERIIEVQMPGLPVDQVHYTGDDGQNPFHYPRLYVDGGSWLWCFAVDACEPGETQ